MVLSLVTLYFVRTNLLRKILSPNKFLPFFLRRKKLQLRKIFVTEQNSNNMCHLKIRAQMQGTSVYKLISSINQEIGNFILVNYFITINFFISDYYYFLHYQLYFALSFSEVNFLSPENVSFESSSVKFSRYETQKYGVFSDFFFLVEQDCFIYKASQYKNDQASEAARDVP